MRRNVHFNPGNSAYSVFAIPARNVLLDAGWIFTDDELGPSPEAFITIWEVREDDLSGLIIGIPALGDSNNYTVYWGDDTVTENETRSTLHTYASPGRYTVYVFGELDQIAFAHYTLYNRKLAAIQQWGSIQWTSMAGAFAGCWILQIQASDVPDLSRVTDMSGMFSNATYFNGDISNWDVGSVTDMSYMFASATKFNGDISGWNVENVTNMFGMFDHATSFDGDLGAWDVRNVLNFDFMFYGTALSTGNYDSLLNGWASLGIDQYRGVFFAGQSRYSRNAEAAHRKLSSYLLIIDFGLDPDYPLLTTTEAADTTAES